MSKKPSTTAGCPCGGPSLAACCGPYIAGAAIAPTAETLMRSRYSAYTLRDEAYLRATWHAQHAAGRRHPQQRGKIAMAGT